MFMDDLTFKCLVSQPTTDSIKPLQDLEIFVLMFINKNGNHLYFHIVSI